MADKQAKALTKNQQLVLDVLKQSHAPMSAYGILDELRDEGFRGPPQVYRAIEKLSTMGHVHRIESLNAFIACSHPSCEGGHTAIVFMICESCGDAREIMASGLTGFLDQLSDRESFKAENSMVELRGTCAQCAG